MNNIKNVAIYCRVSTEEQATEGYCLWQTKNVGYGTPFMHGP